MIEEDIKNFEKLYLNIPEAERKMIIVIIDYDKITWERAYKEIKSKTDLGSKIIYKLHILEIL
jgi:hypothetical protein